MAGFAIGFMLGLAVGLWAGRKHARHPQYFSTLIDKVKR